MEKKFISPKLVKGATWYIEYYDPHRLRRTFDLNRIQDKKIRLQEAKKILDRLNGQESKNIASTKEKTRLIDAIQVAYETKITSERKNTRKSYQTIYNKLMDWITKHKMEKSFLEDFTYKHAKKFILDAASGLCNTTYNNQIQLSKSLFYEIIREEPDYKNPFVGIQPKKHIEKTRRHFEDWERDIMIEAIREKDHRLYLATLLQYYCFIRPVELTRIRFRNFDFHNGTIKVESYEAKAWKTRVLTIPDSIIHYFACPEFNKFPSNWFVFGHKLQPDPSRKCAENRMYNLHRDVLEDMHRQGKLPDINGLSFYSWKDTGCTNAAKFLSPFELRDQLGHATLDQIMVYYHQDEIIEKVKFHPVQL